MVRAITLVCAFAALFAIAYAADDKIKCFTCTTCSADDVKEESKECGASDKKCYTIKNDGKIQTKGCGACPATGSTTTTTTTTTEASKPRAEDSCEECDGNECNSAASLSSSLFIGVVGAMLLKYYY